MTDFRERHRRRYACELMVISYGTYCFVKPYANVAVNSLTFDVWAITNTRVSWSNKLNVYSMG